ncbi:RND transporter [Bryobacterales bacterium F-183]|nr:RND transporter [Bryobacterales bacterium F-183]
MQKLAEICIKRPVFATMIVLALLVTGMFAYGALGVDRFPKVELPIVTITTVLRGASPEEVETQVTKRIEEVCNTVSGIDELRSTSAEGISQVFIQFVLEKDPDVAIQEIRAKVNTVLNDLPRDADQPIVDKISTDATPILNIVIASPRDAREITKIADDKIKKSIESLNGVGEVRFVGDRKRQIQVEIDGEKLYSYNLNIDQVRSALAAQNVEIPGGRIDQGRLEVSLRTLGRVEKPMDFNRIIIAAPNGSPVRIADIGKVTDGVEEPRSLARLDDQPAVVLEIRKQSGTNVLEVINAVKARIEEIRPTLPKDIRITYTRDLAPFIVESFEAVKAHLIEGGIFAALIVFVFIRNWSATIISALAIPASIISTFTLIYAMGYTLNEITMLALVLMVGIVIDDAIVVLENIFKVAEEKKISAMEAAVEGTREIGLAVLATTLSLAIIFIPVALMSGIVGRFMSSFGFTAAFAIMVSLLVSFTLTPMLSSRFLKIDHKQADTKDSIIFKIFDRPYVAMLEWSMRHRWAIGLISILVVVSTVPLFMMIGKSFIPNSDQSEFEITVRTPPGSSLEGTDQVIKQIEADVKKLPGVLHVLTAIGADFQRQVDRGSVLVELVHPSQRKETQEEIMGITRKMLTKYQDVTLGVQYPAAISGGGSDRELVFAIQGPDLNKLADITNKVVAKVRTVPGVVDLESSYEAGKPELRVNINRDKAADLNVSVASIASAMRTLVGGDEQATTFRDGEDRYDVMLRVNKEFRNSQSALNRLYVPSTSLGNVPVSNLATLAPATGPTKIERFNRQRQILIQGNIGPGGSLSEAINTINQTVAEMNLPYEYSTGLLGRSKELGRAAQSFLIALVLSLIFMYMILAAQFESFIDPVTILLSLPLSVPFAVLSLLLMGENFSIIYSSLGILVLFGIVKKNSILQIDHIKQLRAKGYARYDAILKGCQDRLRPILMTTAALVAGMIPLALGTGAGAGARRTVAIAVIGGQTLCLLLSLLVTPVAYSFFDDIAHSPLWGRFARLFRWRKPAVAAPLSVLLIGALLFSEQQAYAQVPQRVGVGVTETRLTLKEAVEMALKNNLDIEIERTNQQIASEQIRAALGQFDPVFRWNPLYNRQNQPTPSPLAGVNGVLADRINQQNFLFQGRTPWAGGTASGAFDNARQVTNNPFVNLTPYYTTRITLSYVQPLLRGRKLDQQRNEIRIRRKSLNISEADFQIRAIDIVARVEQAYWDLVAARQDVNVTQQAVQLAQEQFDRNQRMIESGTLAPVELSASRAELERRKDLFFTSNGVLNEVENNLKSLLAPNRTASIWGDQIIPTDLKSGDAPEVTDLRTAVDQAVARRPELKQLGLRMESNDYDKQLARELSKPRVDVVASYINAGLAGALNTAPNPFSASTLAQVDRLNQLSTLAGLGPLPGGPGFGSVPDSLIGGYGSALSNLFGGNYQSVQFGLNIDLTFRNRTAKAQEATAEIQSRRLKLEQTRWEQLIEAQVRNSVQAIQTARQRIAAATASETAAREKLESETRLFQTGESTNFLVLTRQNEYLDARRRAVVAQLELNKASARFDQAQGTTLSSFNLTVK